MPEYRQSGKALRLLAVGAAYQSTDPADQNLELEPEPEMIERGMAEEILTDLIADARHAANLFGLDWDRLEDRAMDHVLTELASDAETC